MGLVPIFCNREELPAAPGPDAVKRGGVGHMIGGVIESQALEGVSLSGGLSMLVSLLELVFAALVLRAGAAPGTHLILLALFAIATLAGGWRFFRRPAAWSRSRLDMTNGLIEAMVGHRTRLAQERPDSREAKDDGAMRDYLAVSTEMDRAGLLGVAPLGSL